MAENSFRIIIRQRIKPGKLEDFKRLTESYTMGIKESEPGTCAYEWFMGDEPDVAYLNEQYDDTESFEIHGQGLQAVIGEMLEAWSMEEMLVLGNPAPHIKEMLAGFGAKFYTPTVGFCR